MCQVGLEPRLSYTVGYFASRISILIFNTLISAHVHVEKTLSGELKAQCNKKQLNINVFFSHNQIDYLHLHTVFFFY